MSQPAPDAPDPGADPRGPFWAWTTAWSLQGGAALLAAWVWPEPGWTQFSLMGLGAGLPLVGLYLYLGRRPT